MGLTEILRQHRPHYSKMVVLGLEKQGNAANVLRIARVSQSKAQNVLSENAWLTDAQMAAIEKATGQSAGQLALIGADIKDRSINELVDTLATIRFDNAPSPAVSSK